MGLVVFPFKRPKAKKQNHKKMTGYADFVFCNTSLSDLHNKGWPEWQQDQKKLDNLELLLTNMRHAVAHGNVKFTGDQRCLKDVVITFENWDIGKLKWSGKRRSLICILPKALPLATRSDRVDPPTPAAEKA
jgi:hypothetical protein